MRTILLKDIDIDKSSYVDPNGFVFHHNNRLFRAINPQQESFYRELFNKGIIKKLYKDFSLVPSEITDYSIPEIKCNLIIEHKEIKPLTYCVEWCPSMIKKAACATLELSLALLDYNCILQDAYPWNVLYESTKPVFVDLTSIVPIEKEIIWPAYQQFINFFIYPLKLISMRKGKIARLLLYDYINGITLDDINANYSFSYSLRHPIETTFSSLCAKIVNKIQGNPILKRRFQDVLKNKRINQYNNMARKNFFVRLLKRVNQFCIKSEKTPWPDYYENINEDFNIQKKIKIVKDILFELRPKSVLDLGSNVGRYSIIAAKSGARVISIDTSESCIEQLFKKADLERYAITPIIADVINPTPSYGFLAKQFPSLHQRIRSDVVLCLGLMHHLHINARQSFERIALILNELADRAVIFEYVDSTDNNIHLLDCGRKIDYSIETVSESLSRYFTLNFFESDRPTRKIILCKK